MIWHQTICQQRQVRLQDNLAKQPEVHFVVCTGKERSLLANTSLRDVVRKTGYYQACPPWHFETPLLLKEPSESQIGVEEPTDHFGEGDKK